MPDEEPAVLWKKFYVHVAGKTNGAHVKLVEKLRGIGHTEVKNDNAQYDYVLVICPAVSRVGTNISEALDSMPAGKPVILVVMHHTFNNKQVVAESRRQVNNPNVRLTVDLLFYEGNLLDNCDRNDIAWSEIKKFLQGPNFQVSRWNLWGSNCMDDSSKWIIGVVIAVAVLVLLVTTLIYVNQKKN